MRLQGQRSEFQSRLCEVQEKNGRLQEEMKEIEEENRDLKELVDLTEKERNVRLCNYYLQAGFIQNFAQEAANTWQCTSKGPEGGWQKHPMAPVK